MSSCRKCRHLSKPGSFNCHQCRNGIDGFQVERRVKARKKNK